MRIYNVSTKTSKRTFCIFLIISVVLTGALAYYYLQIVHGELSFSAFFDWYIQTYHGFEAYCKEPDEKLLPVIAFFVLPVAIYLTTIISFVSRCIAVRKFQDGLNVKSLDFSPEGIRFNFTKSIYDSFCKFSDVTKLRMILHTIMVHNKNGSSYPAVSEIELFYTIYNNKTYSIKNTPINIIKFIYKIIDLNRQVPDFSYIFKGAGIVEDIKEKIEDYHKSGFKQILSTPQEKSCKVLSILFFVLGVVLLLSFKDLAKKALEDGLWFIFIPGAFFMVVSLFADLFLLSDKIKEMLFYKKTQSDKKADFSAFLIFISKIILFLVMVVVFFPYLLFSWGDKKILSISNQSPGFEKLTINPLSEYNNLSKDEIYTIRKNYVENSIFNNESYEPNSNVFGGIVDKKPWWTVKPCLIPDDKGDYKDRIKGVSKVSALVNNPDNLVGISLPYITWYWKDNKDFCDGEYANFLPHSIDYDKENNIIVARYNVPKSFTKLTTNVNGKTTGYLLQLSGLNAIDFGYKYVYAFNVENIKMLRDDGIIENVGMFSDYIHLGQSCKIDGGCNNISPMQEDKMFTISDIPAEIDLKLWKEKPYNEFKKADIYFKMVFDDSSEK